MFCQIYVMLPMSVSVIVNKDRCMSPTTLFMVRFAVM